MMRTGTCVCGASSFELEQEPLFTQACHCRHCQRATGSAFMLSLVMEQVNLKLLRGQLKTYDFCGGSGQHYDLNTCADCGTALWANRRGQTRGLAYIRAGTLNDLDGIKPQAHIYTQSKLSWLQLPTDIPAFEGLYRMEQLWPPASIARFKVLQEAIHNGHTMRSS